MGLIIDAADYVTYTERDAAEATTARIATAEALTYAIVGRKVIDLTLMSTKQVFAIQNFTSRMVEYLYINGDKTPSTQSFTIGKFAQKGTDHADMTDLFLPYQLLKANACIDLRVYGKGQDYD
jgi:hypothetical protein